mgnify:CR=1 FL=1
MVKKSIWTYFGCRLRRMSFADLNFPTGSRCSCPDLDKFRDGLGETRPLYQAR